MKLSRKTRTRLVVLNVTLWAVCAVIALAVLGGPRGVVREYVEPIDREGLRVFAQRRIDLALLRGSGARGERGEDERDAEARQEASP